MTITASETSLTSSSSSSAKSNATLPPELPSSSFPFLSADDGVVGDQEGPATVPSTPFLAAPAAANAGDGAGSRRGSSFLLGRASVAGTGLSKSDPTLNFFVEDHKAAVSKTESSTVAATTMTKAVIEPTPSLSATPAVPSSPSPRSHHHHHHHHHRKQSSWQKKMSAMGTMLQGKIMRDKAWYVVQLSKTLEELTESMAEACDGREGQGDRGECGKREEQFIEINVRIKDEVNDIFDHIQVSNT